MSCKGCGGGVPAPAWKWCETCATNRLRTIMGGAPVPTTVERRYHIGARVSLTHNGKRETGKVARCPQGRAYVVDLDSGTRCYPSASELSPEATATMPSDPA